MTRHLELPTILEHATDTETGPGAGRKPVLSLAWSLDPQTGEPVARWIAPTPRPSVVLKGV